MFKAKGFRALEGVSIAAIVIMCPPSAFAQTTQPAVAAKNAEAEAETSRDIVVTAQKRAERLIDAPQSVTALTSDALAKLGATHLLDYATTIPGLAISSSGVGQTQITLRGITTGRDISALTGIYVDDVPYGFSSASAVGSQLALDAGLFDLDRIEVLRGPQRAALLGGDQQRLHHPDERQAQADFRWHAALRQRSDGQPQRLVEPPIPSARLRGGRSAPWSPSRYRGVAGLCA